ncbi:Predicted arabinose efflux permease, MFS family [Williamsia sterculiae]|uniref:Predicted arabinose efflux permease, MFS family n=1 Tax=Williamsia sterculiae TaxID=1344003 RepID=A0A1N7EQK4_9NOCA|nr:Predicted arabinose efflux permease, MFS family [Williamsia sterculiae]
MRRLWVSILCGYLALGATLQQLPGYLVERFDAGPVQVGTVVAAAFLATALTRPFAGRAGDLGFSRTLATVGAVTVVVAGVGHLAAQSIPELCVARLTMGVGEGALFSATLPWVIGGTPASRRGRVSGWFGLSMWSGLSIGPLLAGVAHWLGGDVAVWTTVIGLPVVSVILMLTIDRSEHPTRWSRIFAVRPRELIPPGVARPALCLGLSAYGYGTLTALLILYMSHPDLAGRGIALSIYAASFLVARTIGSPLVDRCGAVKIAVGTLGIQAAGLTMIAVGSTSALDLVGVVVTGIGVGSVYPAASAMTLQQSNAGNPGAAMGSMTSLWDLGILVAGPIGGAIAGSSGFHWAFVVAAAAALASCAIAAAQYVRPKSLTGERR